MYVQLTILVRNGSSMNYGYKVMDVLLAYINVLTTVFAISKRQSPHLGSAARELPSHIF